MKPGILEALRHTAATGQPPVPQRRPTGEQPMTDLHEQLLASLVERTTPPSPSTVYVQPEGTTTPPAPTGPPGPPSVQPLAHAARAVQHRRERDIQFEQAKSRRASALGRLRKGTIEQVLGEVSADDRSGDGGVPAGDPRAVVAPPAEAAPPLRGVPCERCDGKGTYRGAPCEACGGRGRVAGVVPLPPQAGKPLQCPICEGKGFLTFGQTTKWCGRCGGEGYVPDPQVGIKRQHRQAEQPATYAEVKADAEQAVAALLAREADVPLPFDDTAPASVEEGADESVQLGRAGVRAGLLDGDPRDVGGLPVADLRADDLEVLALGGALAAEEPWAEAVPHPPALTYDLPTACDALPPFCFICGPAGTGKTFWAKALSAGDPEGVVLAATTGIAAVNLGEGTTINSYLKFYDTASLTEAFTGGWLEAQLKRYRTAGLRRIVLDEVSMLDGDQLTILSRAIDNVNQDRGGDDPELGLILVGDFAQLPPVKAPFAFESVEWDRYAEATYGLTTIRRQADQDFITALQAVRRGDHTEALAYFESLLQQTTNAHFNGTTILAKNDAVGKFNQLRLDKVPGKALTFGSSRWGKLRPEWGGPPKPPFEWGVPEVLSLKEGALVMILANRNIAEKGEPPEYLYVNGDLGEIVSSEHGAATVVLQRTGEEVTVVPITRENLIPLEVGRRKALKEEGHPERISANGKSEVIGACSYMPLRLAYASTVHKSQGLSLDQVQVNIRDHFFSTPGMLYVALSRARTCEGLRLVGTKEAFRARCTVSQKVLLWL